MCSALTDNAQVSLVAGNQYLGEGKQAKEGEGVTPPKIQFVVFALSCFSLMRSQPMQIYC